jgi:hypothetical protein
MNRAMKLLTCILALSAVLLAQSDAKPAGRWEPLRFLFGDWVAKGTGAPGTAVGECSFHEELNGQILVRRSFADSAAPGGARHEDLLVIYAATPAEPLHAIYFDSEGHVIHYNVRTKPNAAVFESDSSPTAARYRLSYSRAGDTLNGTFETAPPGGVFRTYLTWSSTPK